MVDVIIDGWAGSADIVDGWAGGADMVGVMVDGADLPKSEYMDSVSPIQMPIFPCWIYIGVNNANNFFILLKCFKIVYIFN